MRRTDFHNWMTTQKCLAANTAASRCGNCATIEHHYGRDLDIFYAEDCLKQLLVEFKYSMKDQTQNAPARHKVPINGDIYNGTSSLKGALRLYQEFRGWKPPFSEPGNAPDAGPMPPGPGPKPPSLRWSEWPHPSDAEYMQLAKVLTRYVRFLRPDIVREVVKDNEERRAKWSEGLRAKGVDSDAYLWQGSPCAFPGVRRHAGSDEIAKHKGQKAKGAELPPGALRLDDNSFPKQLWSFLFLGKKFSNFGPDGYSLAHLADHKNYKNRAAGDFDLEGGSMIDGRLFGLHTCPTNTVYVPVGLLKPTDFNGHLRGLLIRRAHALYGSFCALVPPFLKVRESVEPTWHIDQFEWADPVGDTTHLAAFLEFRASKMAELMPD